MELTEKLSRKALEDAKAASDKAESALKEAQKVQNITRAITFVETKGYRNAEAILLDLRQNDRLNRQINFILANMYKREKDYKSAVDVMNKYIEDMRAANKEKDEAYGAALYNRACYRTLKAMSPPRDDALLAEALGDLKRAIEFDPLRRGRAWEDEDFNGLRDEENPRFAEIVGRNYSELTKSEADKSLS